MNTKTRKIIAMILGLALTISLFGGVTVFAAGTITVGLSATPSPVINNGSTTTNNTVAVTASVTANSNVVGGLIGYSVKITYDTSKFNYTSIAKSTVTPTTGVISTNNDSANGILYIVYYANDELPATALTPILLAPVDPTALFTAVFTVKATATAGTGSFTITGIDTLDNFVDTASTVGATYPVAASDVAVQVPPAYIVGDVNASGLVDVTDALLVMQYTVGLVSLSGTNLLAADVNHLNGVDVTDALLIMQYTVGLVTIS
jgi:hypothetical protein